MTIVIIEDERLTAEDLKDIILQTEPTAEVTATLTSVKESIAYFRTHPTPDLIFSDIQLGDGLSFDIFQEIDVKAPIIFCTAYNEYALNAFETNGIHYILKPFDENAIINAIEKYKNLQLSFGQLRESVSDLLQLFQDKKEPKAASILVYQKDQIIPIKLEDIALFYIKNDVTHLYTFGNKTYYINKTLDEVQQIGGNMFYRANRQFIVNKNAVRSVSQYLARKVSIELKVPFDETITVSKEKITSFLEWLETGGN